VNTNSTNHSENRAFRCVHIQTDRLHLAPLLPEAAEELHAITDNPLITDAISFLPTPFSLYDARALIHDHFNDQDRFLRDQGTA